MSNRQLIIISGIVLAAVAIFFVLRPSDEEKILKKLDLMAEYCTTEQQEPAMVTLQKVASAAKLCTDPCLVKLDSVDVDQEFTRKEISDRILMLKKRLVGATFTFQDTSFTSLEGDNAALTTTLRLNGKTVDGRFTDAYELDIAARKIEGEWLFSSFVVVEFVER